MKALHQSPTPLRHRRQSSAAAGPPVTTRAELAGDGKFASVGRSTLYSLRIPGGLWLVASVVIVSALMANAAGAAAPAFNLDGKWSPTFHCGQASRTTGKLVVSKWNASTGKLNEKLTFGKKSEKGTATESGSTVTVNSSNVAAVIGRVGHVVKNGSKLVMTFNLTHQECPTGGSVVFTNDHPKASSHPKKKKHKKK